MNPDDPVLRALAALPVPRVDPGRARALRARAAEKLRPRPLHPAWAWLVASGVAGYLGSALYFTLHLFRAPLM